MIRPILSTLNILETLQMRKCSKNTVHIAGENTDVCIQENESGCCYYTIAFFIKFFNKS